MPPACGVHRRVHIVRLDVLHLIEWNDDVPVAHPRDETREPTFFFTARGRHQTQPPPDTIECGVETVLGDRFRDVIHRVGLEAGTA